MTAAQLLESKPEEKKKNLSEQFYDLLDKNKEAFIFATTEEIINSQKRRGRDSSSDLLRILKLTLKNSQKLTDIQELYLKNVMIQLEEGVTQTNDQKTLKSLEKLNNELMNPYKVLAVLQTIIPERLLQSHYAEQNSSVIGKREIILSMYLTGD